MKSDVVRFRLSEDEREAFETAATVAGVSLSSWMRERLRRACRYELEEARMQIPFLRPKKADNG